MPLALQLRDCRLQRGGATILDGLSLEVAPGEIVGLAGANGTGKTTTLALAAGVLRPQSGLVIVDGLVSGFATRLGYVPQDCALYDELTAEQNLEFFGRLQGLRGVELDQRIARGLARAGLTQRADERVERFSGGLKQRLGIACALLHDPVLILLDEPTASLDVASRDGLFRELMALRDEGRGILLTTHHWEAAESVCDRIVHLAHGKILPLAAAMSRPLLYGHLRELPTDYHLREWQARCEENGAELEVVGRRLRLAAGSSESLGRALAMLLAEGAVIETFRTPPVARRSPVLQSSIHRQ